MHELSVATSLLEQIEELRLKENFKRVTKIRLRIGKISGVVPENLLFCFKEVCEGTVLDGCVLDFEVPQVLLWCPRCQAETEAQDSFALFCEKCFSPSVEVKSGRELEIIAIDVI